MYQKDNNRNNGNGGGHGNENYSGKARTCDTLKAPQTQNLNDLVYRVAIALEHNNRFQAMQARHAQRLTDVMSKILDMIRKEQGDYEDE
jgi:predicted transcriptional regulator